MSPNLLAGVGSIALVGCVSTSEVVPMGRDSYMVQSTSRGGVAAGKERIEAVKTANAYCAAQTKHMIVRRTDTSGAAGWTPVTNALVFSCVTDDDPEWKRPDLHKDANVVIEDQRK